METQLQDCRLLWRQARGVATPGLSSRGEAGSWGRNSRTVVSREAGSWSRNSWTVVSLTHDGREQVGEVALLNCMPGRMHEGRLECRLWQVQGVALSICCSWLLLCLSWSGWDMLVPNRREQDATSVCPRDRLEDSS